MKIETLGELNSARSIGNSAQWPLLIKPFDKGSETRHHLTTPKLTCTPLFYGLLKVHKLNILIRPIVSACDSPPINFQTMSPTSYNLLWRLFCHTSGTANFAYSSLNSSHLFVGTSSYFGGEVTPLNTNTPHVEGIESVLHYTSSFHTIGIFLKSFSRITFYSWVGILCKWSAPPKAAPPYANLFIDIHEEAIQDTIIWVILF